MRPAVLAALRSDRHVAQADGTSSHVSGRFLTVGADDSRGRRRIVRNLSLAATIDRALPQAVGALQHLRNKSASSTASDRELRIALDNLQFEFRTFAFTP